MPLELPFGSLNLLHLDNHKMNKNKLTIMKDATVVSTSSKIREETCFDDISTFHRGLGINHFYTNILLYHNQHKNVT